MTAPMFVQREIAKAVSAERERCIRIAKKAMWEKPQVEGKYGYRDPTRGELWEVIEAAMRSERSE